MNTPKFLQNIKARVLTTSFATVGTAGLSTYLASLAQPQTTQTVEVTALTFATGLLIASAPKLLDVVLGITSSVISNDLWAKISEKKIYEQIPKEASLYYASYTAFQKVIDEVIENETEKPEQKHLKTLRDISYETWFGLVALDADADDVETIADKVFGNFKDDNLIENQFLQNNNDAQNNFLTRDDWVILLQHLETAISETLKGDKRYFIGKSNDKILDALEQNYTTRLRSVFSSHQATYQEVTLQLWETLFGKLDKMDKKLDRLLERDQSPAPKPLPKNISTQELKPPEYFTGRGQVIKDIRKTLNDHRTAALCGISGLGKTSTVLKYAEENSAVYEHIVFVRVDDASFDANVDRTCELLGIKLTPEDKKDAKALKFRARVEELAENVSADERRVLLIFDNTDDAVRITKFMPHHERLHVLLTSNSTDIYQRGHRVEIENLPSDEAELLLYRVATLTDAENLGSADADERAAIAEIVKLFGYHPLAIFIAGNYIAVKGKTFGNYLARLKKAESKILKDEKGADAYHQRDIYSAFDIAFNAICDSEEKTDVEIMQIEIAKECMIIASMLAPDAMPEEIFRDTASLVEDWREYLEDDDNWDDVYQRLSNYKLFERNGKAATLTIHRLVRLYLSDKLKDEQTAIEKPLAAILAKHFEDYDFTNKKNVERFLPHVGAFLDRLEETAKNDRTKPDGGEMRAEENTLELSLENKSTAVLCNRYARYYERNGKYTTAERYCECFKNICEMNNEIDETLTATSYNNLAGLYQTQGRYKEAEPYYYKDLEISRRILGEDHPDMATSYNNLALLYQTQGRYEEAEPYYVKALEIKRRVFGEDHPLTALSYNNLAALYRTQGRYGEAEPCYNKALNIRRRVLGEDHPETATSYNDLALLYQTQGRYKEAETFYLKVKGVFEKTLGLNHPWTATSYNNLALLYRKQGRDGEVEPYYDKALEIKRRVFGEDHPNTALSYMNLGALYYATGRVREGLELCEKALGIYRNALPAGHPSIQNCERWVEKIKKALDG